MATFLDALRMALENVEIVTRESPDYARSIKRWSDVAERRAAIVVYPTTASQVSMIVKLASTHSMPLAVCGGGHSTGGDSSSEGGLVIDLSKMRKVTVNPSDKTVRAEGGCLWVDVDVELGKHGLATVGGTVNHTGIGGLTLGGGYGFLSGVYGLTVDNLLSVEMVLADGSTVTASETSNEDLFWAIRGAGASFGIATSFTFQAHTISSPVYAGFILWPASFAPQLIEFANSIVTSGQPETVIHAALACPPFLQGEIAVLAACFHCGPASAAEQVFAPLLQSDIPPIMNTCKELPYCEVNGIYGDLTAHGGRKSTKGATFRAPLDPETFTRIQQMYSTFVSEVPDAAKTVVVFEFYRPEKVLEKSSEDMAIPRSAMMNAAVQPSWMMEENDATCRQFARDIARVIHEADGKGESAEHREYVNYDGTGISPKVIFGENFERLAKLKIQYDPKNVFKKNVGLRPLP